jgi:hypothetical protein
MDCFLHVFGSCVCMNEVFVFAALHELFQDDEQGASEVVLPGFGGLNA